MLLHVYNKDGTLTNINNTNNNKEIMMMRWWRRFIDKKTLEELLTNQIRAGVLVQPIENSFSLMNIQYSMRKAKLARIMLLLNSFVFK